MKPSVYSIGHSNNSLERLLVLLDQHRVEALVDIRRFPGSRKYPHFNQESLAAALPDSGMEYHWLEALGGRRRAPKGGPASLNLDLRNESFRNYADYMLTEEFRRGVERLLEIAARNRVAIMCAEAVFWRCHRRLVSRRLPRQPVFRVMNDDLGPGPHVPGESGPFRVLAPAAL